MLKPAELCGAALLGSGRINDRGNFRDPICREAPLLGMLPNHLFVRCDVDAVDLVAGHVALHPLNLWTHLAEHTA